MSPVPQANPCDHPSSAEKELVSPPSRDGLLRLGRTGPNWVKATRTAAGLRFSEFHLQSTASF